MFNKLGYKICKYLEKKCHKVKSDLSCDFQNLFDKKKYVAPNNTYETLVAVTGFGYSGSGALLDFLSEFEDVTVFSDADPDGSLRDKNYNNGTNELNLFRHVGGLFFLEKFFPSLNIFIQDGIIKMFIMLVKEHYLNNGAIFNNEFLKLTNEFLNHIIDLKFKTECGSAYQPHLPQIGNQSLDFINFNNSSNKYLITLKPISREEYVFHAKNYIQSFFKTIESKKYLVLDQALSDNECDIEHYKEYIDNLKLIAVYRDPRDLYATAVSKNVTWIPQDVDKFIKWYRRSVTPYFENKNDDYLLIRFEDLVYNKIKIQNQIETFLGFKLNSHIAPKIAFDEFVSINNIGLYNTINKQDEITKIEEALPEFLYKFDMSEQEKPLVSICCLSYNHAKFIQEAIESFWNQEYKNIEIIALDDGSNDNSVEVLENLAKISPCPMTVLSQKNTGNVPANFNKLLKKANGKYISMIALDDILTQDSISKKLWFMENNNDIAFVFDSVIKEINEDSIYIGDRINSTYGYNTLTCEELFDKEYHQKWTFYTQGSLFRKNILIEINGYDEDMISDDDVLRLKLFNYLKNNKNKKCYILSTPSCCYRHHTSNVSNNLYNNCLMISEVFDRFFPNAKKSVEYKKRAKALIKNLSYEEFNKLNYFKNENKSSFQEWLFFHLYKKSKLFRLIVR